MASEMQTEREKVKERYPSAYWYYTGNSSDRTEIRIDPDKPAIGFHKGFNINLAWKDAYFRMPAHPIGGSSYSGIMS